MTTHLKTRHHYPFALGMAAVLALVTGCGAVHTMVKKRNLDVQTKMSETIFLEPVKPADKVIFIDVRNTSDKDLPIVETIRDKLTASGYTITDDPDKGNFMLQANVLQCGKSDLRAAGDAWRAGYGGAVIGATAGYATGGSGRSAATGGLIGAAAGVVGDALVDDVLYSMITDLQIRERPRRGEIVTQSQATNASIGTASTLHQSVSGGQVNWKTYRTRIVSTANKANLKFEEAQPVLMDGLVKSISGVF